MNRLLNCRLRKYYEKAKSFLCEALQTANMIRGVYTIDVAMRNYPI